MTQRTEAATQRTPKAAEVDLAVVGFGFAGLAVVLNLLQAGSRLKVAVLATDDSGLGHAYGTSEAAHLLNVPASSMGAWADDGYDFAAWLGTEAAVRSAETIGVAVPVADDYAPRVLYGCYLASLRDRALRAAPAGTGPRFIRGRADRVVARAGGGWIVQGDGVELRARACVLAVGNESRPVFGALAHPRLYDGWAVPVDVVDHDGPIVLIGSGLTAVDAVLQLRARGRGGEILMLSRRAALPQAHLRTSEPLAIEPEVLARIARLGDVVGYLNAQCEGGHDCRAVIDGLRPHTNELWQRLPLADQRKAITRWAPAWNNVRHRMAPQVGALIDDELLSSSTRVAAVRHIDPIVDGERLSIAYERADGRSERIENAAVVDCTGQELAARRRQPLVRRLLEDRVCVAHGTGLGLCAGPDYTVAEDLYALGSILTGQLWETIAVPEVRGQAARIADAVMTTIPVIR